MKMRLLAFFAFLISYFAVYADVVVQGESGMYDGKVDNSHSGYTGTGFVDFTNVVGSKLTLEFTLAEEMPSSQVLVRWANGKSDDRAMSITVNDVLQVTNLPFASSGSFTTWLETSIALNLRKGTNRVVFTSLTPNGGPNFDKITITGASEGVKEFALTVHITGKGSVVKTPDLPFYPKGSTVQLQAIPNAAMQATFMDWSGSITSTNPQTSVIIDTVKTVIATFKSSIHKTYYCAPAEKGGNDANEGTIDAPFFNLSKATNQMEPGDTVYLRGGIYRYKATIFLSGTGNELAQYCIFNYPNEKPVLNFYDIFSNYANLSSTARGEARGFKITGNYYYLKGLEICQAPDNGIKIEGSYNTCELLTLHHNGDTGIQIGLAKDSPDAANKVCCNLTKNCDSYRNLDWGTGYENADGFACKLSPGANNRYVGCRAWENADDGWDFYMTHFTIYVDSCWTTGNGNPDLIKTNDPDWEYGQKNTIPIGWAGDGNGFKLGGDDWAAKHQVKNCISFDGYETGACFSENNNADSLFIFNCVAWQGNKNFRVRAYPSDLRNNISFDAKVGGESQMFDLAAGSTEKNNSWNTIDGQYPLVPYKTAAGKSFDQLSIYNQFVSTSKSDFLAPRETDGSLPKNGFGKLKEGSFFIDKGIGVVRGINSITLKSDDFSLPFSGTGIDLGAYEHYSPTPVLQIISTNKNIKAYPNPFFSSTTIEFETGESTEGLLTITDLTGKIIYEKTISELMKGEKRTLKVGEKLNTGIYIVSFTTKENHQSIRMIKLQKTK